MEETSKKYIEQTEEDLAREIIRNRETGESTFAKLAVDDRVLARITDGIYRQPSSAFRELISNAYDADARSVVIHTDCPRFNRIVIRDDGNGMGPESLAYMLKHIGGSSKRTRLGMPLATVNEINPDLSPSGRRLIGKIGIGLFSVAQLTQHFQIITKRKGDSFKTSADVVMQTYTEDSLKNLEENEEFVTGEVTITSEMTNEIDSHGTEVILMDLRNSAKEILRSVQRWQAVDNIEGGENAKVFPPRFHIGRIFDQNENYINLNACLPWDAADSPQLKFIKLYHEVGAEVEKARSAPNVEAALDNYLSMLWTLSLQAPIRYIEKHPFELTGNDGVRFFLISEKPKGTAEEIFLSPGQRLGDKLNLNRSNDDPLDGFKVTIDGIELLRPICFDNKLRSAHAIGCPLMFVGKCKSKLGDYPATLGGGALEFDVYFYWNSRIVPKENNGILVRINNSTGVSFDRNFMDYQVSEMNRLRQLSSEVFIHHGLDAALNIDRESFNLSHPHYQFLMRWIHAAIRQTTNKLKSLGHEALRIEKTNKIKSLNLAVEKHAFSVWNRRRGDDADQPPEINLVLHKNSDITENNDDMPTYVVNEDLALKLDKNSDKITKVKALITVLEAWELFEKLSYTDQVKLISDIYCVFDVD